MNDLFWILIKIEAIIVFYLGNFLWIYLASLKSNFWKNFQIWAWSRHDPRAYNPFLLLFDHIYCSLMFLQEFSLQTRCYDLVILSSYGPLFHFNAASFSRVLPPSLPFVIMHCTIHVFLILQLIVYVTHSFYLDTCTYISNDLHTSMDS